MPFVRCLLCVLLSSAAFAASPVFFGTEASSPPIITSRVSPGATVGPAWIPNRGQAQAEVELFTRHGGAPAWTFLRRDGLTTTLYRPDLLERGWVHLNFVDAKTPVAAPSRPTGARSGYYLGADPSHWLEAVPHYAHAAKLGVWRGIDFEAESVRGHVEYRWRVAPEADPTQIRLAVADAESVEIAPSGDLVFQVRTGEIRHRAPLAFQSFDGKRRFVPVAFEIDDEGRIGFALGDYDPSRELIIDPEIVPQVNRARLLRRSGYSSAAGTGQDFLTSSELHRLPDPKRNVDVYLLMQMGATASPSNGWGTVSGVRDVYFEGTVHDLEFPQEDYDFFGVTVGGNGDEIPRAMEGGSAHPGNGIFHYAAVAQSASANAPIVNASRAYQTSLSGSSDAYGIDLDWAFYERRLTVKNTSFIGGSVAENATDADFFVGANGTEYSVFTLSTRSGGLRTINPISPNLQGIEDVFFLSTCRDAQDQPFNVTATYLPGLGTEAFPQAEHVSILGGPNVRDRLWYFVASDSAEIPHTEGLIGGDYLAPGANMRISGYEEVGTTGVWGEPKHTWLDAGPGVETPSGVKSSYYVNDRWQLNDHWSFNIGFRYEEAGGQAPLDGQLFPGTSALNPGGASNYIAVVDPGLTRVEAHGFLDGSASENLQGVDWALDGLCLDLSQITTSTNHLTTVDAPYPTYPGGAGNGIFRRYCRGPDNAYQLHFSTYSGFPGDYTPRTVASTEFLSIFGGFSAGGLPIIGGGGQYHGDLDPTQQVFAQFPIFEKAMLTGGSFQLIDEIGPQSLLTIFSPYPLAEGLTVGGPDDLGVWPESLDGVQAFFDDQPTSIIFTSPNQMSLFTPRTFAGPQTNFRIEVDGLISNTITFDVGATAPEILTQNASGAGLGAILNQDFTLNTLANPADDGEVIQVFYIPGVDLSPTCPDGTLTPLAEPLPRTPLPTEVHIAGGQQTTIYAGGAPGALCGAGQANAIVDLPDAVPAGVSEQPLEIHYDGLMSQPGVTVAVRK